MWYLKQRIFALIITLVSGSILYWVWYDALHHSSYYLKAATFAPLGIVAGIFLIFFPKYSGKPETALDKIIVMSIFVVGMLFGLYNWYLLDPAGFPF